MINPQFTAHDYIQARHILLFAQQIVAATNKGDLNQYQLDNLESIQEACKQLIKKIDGHDETCH